MIRHGLVVALALATSFPVLAAPGPQLPVQAEDTLDASALAGPGREGRRRRRNRDPQPPPPVYHPAPMDEAAFNSLRHAIAAETFSDDKLDVLRAAAAHAFFTVDQVGQMVELYTFSSDKLTVVRIAKPRILDPQNGFRLAQRFTFSSDKQEVMAILAEP